MFITWISSFVFLFFSSVVLHRYCTYDITKQIRFTNFSFFFSLVLSSCMGQNQTRASFVFILIDLIRIRLSIGVYAMIIFLYLLCSWLLTCHYLLSALFVAIDVLHMMCMFLYIYIFFLSGSLVSFFVLCMKKFINSEVYCIF